MSTTDPFDSNPYDSMNSPTMGLAMGLLSASGPSRMPVSLGQALAAGIQSGGQYGTQGRATELEQLRFLMALQRLQQTRAASMSPPQTPAGASTSASGDAP